MTRSKKIAVATGLIVGLIVVLVAMILVWLSDVAEPMPEALAALTSDEQVTVSTDPWLVFEPTDVVPEAGFIFYPGGKVDPRAYAPPARAIAENGYLVVIVPMPLNLAVLAPNRADEVIEAFPQIERWTIGGHSLGGTMAANYAQKQAEQIDALALWASYPTSNGSLVDRTDLSVASIYGTLDGLVSQSDIENSRELLPPDTLWTPIEGGNHAQFGWYGPQEGDNAATISREMQQAATISATVSLLNERP